MFDCYVSDACFLCFVFDIYVSKVRFLCFVFDLMLVMLAFLCLCLIVSSVILLPNTFLKFLKRFGNDFSSILCDKSLQCNRLRVLTTDMLE